MQTLVDSLDMCLLKFLFLENERFFHDAEPTKGLLQREIRRRQIRLYRMYDEACTTFARRSYLERIRDHT